jgi:acetyltransferase
MVQEIRGYKLLMGFRGRPKADIEAIEKAVISLSNMAVNHPEIKEMDINPLIVHEQGKGTTVADCRIILEAVGDTKR